MRFTRVSLPALASTGLLLSAAALAQDPPFQGLPPPPPPPPQAPLLPLPFDDDRPDPSPAPGAPGAAPAAPPEPPAFDEGPLGSPSPPSPPPSAPAAPAPTPATAPPIDQPPIAPPVAPPGAAPAENRAPRGVRGPAKKRATTAKTPRGKRPSRAMRLGPVATFPGFRMLEGGGSRVFVKLSGRVTVEEHKARGQVIYRLKGADVPTATNRLPLITSFFATPVALVQLVPQGDDVDLVIELRQDSSAQYRIEEQRDGVVLVVDFPRSPVAP